MEAGPSVSRETLYIGDPENIVSQLSEEERNAAEESFSVYYRPLDLYKVLQNRANQRPSFLPRCLRYKIKDQHKRRVQLSVSITRPRDDGRLALSIFPVYILLARPVPTPNGDGEALQPSCYRFKRAFKVTAPNGAQTAGSPPACFILPEINKLLTECRSGSLTILLVSFADIPTQQDTDLTKAHMVSSSKNAFCLMGKTPFDFVHFLMENSSKISLGETAEFKSTVTLKACFMKMSTSDGEKCLSFYLPNDPKNVQVPITITSAELGAKDKSPLDLHSYNNVSTDRVPEVPRPRTEVIFNYKFYNNMLHKTEVTEDYACSFCLLKCASYEGLKCHLPASHDLFNYEFGGEEGYLVVNVTAKITDTSAQIAGNLDREEMEFYFRRTGAGVSRAAVDIIHSGPESATPSLPGSQAPLLQTHRVFHSHSAQHDDVADHEDRRKHGDLVDVTQYEKQIMDLWNLFIRIQREATDAHIPRACEALSTRHGRDIVLNPLLLRCWRLFLVKLQNIGLLDAITMDKCLSILNSYGDQNPE